MLSLSEKERLRLEAEDRTEYSLAYCLQQLKDKPGFPSIKTETLYDKSKRQNVLKNYIQFEFNLEGTWLANPEPNPDRVGAVSQNKDITGVWGEDLKKNSR